MSECEHQLDLNLYPHGKPGALPHRVNLDVRVLFLGQPTAHEKMCLVPLCNLNSHHTHQERQ